MDRKIHFHTNHYNLASNSSRQLVLFWEGPVRQSAFEHLALVYYYQAIKRKVPSRKDKVTLTNFQIGELEMIGFHVLPKSPKANYEAMRDTFINNNFFTYQTEILKLENFKLLAPFLSAPFKISFLTSLGRALSRGFFKRDLVQMLEDAEGGVKGSKPTFTFLLLPIL